MNTELLEALTILEKEKEISKEVMLDAIENSLINACKNHFGKADNIKVIMNRETCEYALYAEKTVVLRKLAVAFNTYSIYWRYYDTAKPCTVFVQSFAFVYFFLLSLCR